MRLAAVALSLLLTTPAFAQAPTFVTVAATYHRTFSATLPDPAWARVPQTVVVLTGTTGLITGFTGGHTVRVCWTTAFAPGAQSIVDGLCESRVPLSALRSVPD